MPSGRSAPALTSDPSALPRKQAVSLLRVMTTVLVFRSTERMSSVAETWPLRMAKRKSLAARAEAPSRTPSLSSAETLAVTSRLNDFAARPDPWPSAMMTDIPPPGRSTISTVSPLSRDAYLLVLTTATSIFNGMTASPSPVPTPSDLIRAKFGWFDHAILGQHNAAGKRGVERMIYRG